MNKKDRKTLPREEWLARRDSPSLGQVLRGRERFKHIVAFREDATGRPVGDRYINRPEGVTLMHMVVIKGRNQRKRNVRSTKASKKEWGVIK